MKEKIKKWWFGLNDITRRAIKTFIQAFVGSLCEQIIAYMNSGNVTVNSALIQSLIIGSIGCGLSALMNYIYSITEYRTEKIKIKEVK